MNNLLSSFLQSIMLMVSFFSSINIVFCFDSKIFHKKLVKSTNVDFMAMNEVIFHLCLL